MNRFITALEIVSLSRRAYLNWLCCGMILITTRRFCALPADVLLEAIGRASPSPYVWVRLLDTPCELRALATERARLIESPWLYEDDPSESV